MCPALPQAKWVFGIIRLYNHTTITSFFILLGFILAHHHKLLNPLILIGPLQIFQPKLDFSLGSFWHTIVIWKRQGLWGFVSWIHSTMDVIHTFCYGPKIGLWQIVNQKLSLCWIYDVFYQVQNKNLRLVEEKEFLLLRPQLNTSLTDWYKLNYKLNSSWLIEIRGNKFG